MQFYLANLKTIMEKVFMQLSSTLTQKIGVLVLMLCLSNVGYSQSKLNGKVIGQDGEGLLGASILIKGTTKGTTTGIDGSYSVDLSSLNDTLIVSYVGYKTQQIAVAGRLVIDVKLVPTMLEEVIVTALGIKREEKALGYAVQKVDDKQLNSGGRDANLLNNLSGKVAGVQITAGGSGVGSSSRIVIRGESSLSGNNQPLFVVNGVPINNSGGGNGRVAGNLEADYGNGAAEINPDDIESMTVLKGANATALYGSRAANGVILITTKKGATKNGKIGVSFNSNTTLESALRVPEYQNRYGQGGNFEFSFLDGSGSGTNDNLDESWGPEMNGQLIAQHNSPTSDGFRAGDWHVRNPDGTITPTPWEAQPENIQNFFRTGLNTSNSISIYGGDASQNFRLSYNNLVSEGILPNTGINRNNISLDLTQKFLNDKLTINTNMNYVKSGGTRPNNSYGTENVMYLWVWFGRQIEMSSLEDYWQPGAEDVQQFNYNYNWHDNPYFTMYENTNTFDKDRVFGNINATYDFTDNLKLMVRTGTDFYNELRVGKRAFSTQRFPLGQYREDKIYFQERNTDALLSYNKSLSEKIDLGLSVGGNQMTQTNRFHHVAANQLAIPGVFSFNNSAIPLSSSQFDATKRINSLYAFASLGFGNAFYIDLAGRNDWSSTLPAANNSYFYPSASASLIIDQLVSLPRAISFAKLRTGWGQVGSDTDPYNTANYFNFLTNPYGGNLLGTEGNTLANADLKPERATTFEIGADVRLYNGRIRLDATYYNTNSINQILQTPVSQTSGYGARFINAGSIQSNGIELLAGFEIISSRDFKWTMSFNYTRQRSTVVELTEGIETYQISSNYLQVLAKEGGRMGDVYGTGFVMIDPSTNQPVEINDVKDIKDDYKILYQDGFPVRDPNLRLLGNYNPDWIAGVRNDFSYKRFNFGFLFDIRQGGVVHSRTLLIGGTSGMMQETALVDRTTAFVGGNPPSELYEDRNVDALKYGGVKAVTDAEGNVTYVENDVEVSARDYFWSHFNRGNEQVGMYDASFVKLREVKMGYSFPMESLTGIKAQNLNVSLVGRNLFLWTQNPHFDPEVFSYDGNTIVPGVEDMATPTTRSIGFNISINF